MFIVPKSSFYFEKRRKNELLRELSASLTGMQIKMKAEESVEVVSVLDPLQEIFHIKVVSSKNL